MNSNELQRQARNAVRKGSILDIDYAAALCRVSVGDPDDETGSLETNWLPWFSFAAGDVRDWRPPTKGEQVMLLCPMGDPAQGVALCGFYSDAFPAPGNTADTHTRSYPDGAVVAYDHAAHVLNVNLPAGATVNVTAPGAVNVNTSKALIKADDMTIDATQTTVTGAMLVKGAFVFENGMSGKAGASGGPAAVISGTVAVSDDVIAGGKSSAHHTHREQGDGQLVSEPQ